LIVLVGFMGAGKSTVGRLFADAVRLPFADSDEMVAARAGRSIPEIFSESGEGLFRLLERDVIGEALERGEGCSPSEVGPSPTPEHGQPSPATPRYT